MGKFSEIPEEIQANVLPLTLEILAMYKQYGGLTYGEEMTLISHSVQSGLIAKKMELKESLIVAAYLHDIGHISPLYEEIENVDMGGFGLNEHDILGANYLKYRGFTEEVTMPISNHVNSKRYLCLKDESYILKLSEASLKTLEFQGGVMDAYEACVFESGKLFEESLILRKIDDDAKENNFVISEFHFQEMADIINEYLLKIGNEKSERVI